MLSLHGPISTIMSRRPIGVRPEARVRDALAVAREHAIEHLLVTETDELVGVVCTCDLVRAPSDTKVASCMKTPVVSIEGTTSLSDAAAIMRSRRVGCLPVTAGRLLVGIVTRADLKRAGVPSELYGASCASCGSQHHVAAARERGVPFCQECLECREARNGADLGAGD